jgi:hypothetical protein
MDQKIIDWLEDSDPVIRFRLHRDLLHSDPFIVNQIRESIATQGWGKAFMDHRNDDKHWGQAYYLPKYTSTHYTLLSLRMIHYPVGDPRIEETIDMILTQNIGNGGGITHSIKYPTSEVCITGMFLNVACYFKAPMEKLQSLIDYLIKTQLSDGGFNCRYAHKKTHHSSVHTTLSVCEGLWEYEKNGYTYRLDEVRQKRKEGEEFLLGHKLFKSDKTDSIINESFLTMPWPYHWCYDVMRALEYFVKSNHPYDPRMQEAIDWLKSKETQGIWPMNPKRNGQYFFTMEKVSRRSKINTVRAMAILIKYQHLE